MSNLPAANWAEGSAIQVHGLEKSYQELRVLRGVDFEVARGSIEVWQAVRRLDALAVESGPRAERLLELMRQHGGASWTRMEWTRLERPAEPAG
ncbi:MAG TPA: hypothetical protein VFQ68_36860 [Streptosporangiaceae bacterium]|nr:hypothetical protein [Streptosporangiaceae bacterium]